MAGRRLREAVSSSLTNNGFAGDVTTVIAGMANEYADYVTTFEEYQVQRYEGGSTIYGPHTLEAFIQVYKELALNMAEGTSSPTGPLPPNLMDNQFTLLPGVIFDAAPLFKNIGDVLEDAESTYTAGTRVSVRFQVRLFSCIAVHNILVKRF